MKPRRALRLVCGLGLAVLALPSMAMVAPRLAPRAEAAFPGRNGRIAVAVTQVPDATGQVGGAVDTDLFTVSPSGHDLHRVTEGHESDDGGPAWSPDGRRIAFSRRNPIGSSSANRDIYVIDPAGGQATNLTASPLQDDFMPSWSPDGTKIVFSGSLGVEADLYIMDSDGRNVVQITDDPGTERYSAWSPQGDAIAYTDDDSIRLIRPDGSESRVVMQAGLALALSWSPDGRRITFAMGGDIWVINHDGSGAKNLMSLSRNASPSWSPDGRWIAFVSSREGDYKLFKMRPDGSDVNRVVDITLDTAPNSRMDWGPRP